MKSITFKWISSKRKWALDLWLSITMTNMEWRSSWENSHQMITFLAITWPPILSESASSLAKLEEAIFLVSFALPMNNTPLFVLIALESWLKCKVMLRLLVAIPKRLINNFLTHSRPWINCGHNLNNFPSVLPTRVKLLLFAVKSYHKWKIHTLISSRIWNCLEIFLKTI